MANWYCSSVAYAAVAVYATAHVYAAGSIVRQSAPALNNERCFRTVAGGTTGGAEPAWIITKGGSTTDSGGVIWVEVTGNEAYQAPGAWAAPHARLANACTTSWMAPGDTVYLAHNHAETQSTASISVNVSQVGSFTLSNIVCVDASGTGHVPPAAGDLRATATVSTTGNNSITVAGSMFYCYGVTFSAASGSSQSWNIILGTSGSGSNWSRFENCQMKLLSSGTGQTVVIGQNNGAWVEFINTPVTLSAAGQGISPSSCTFIWRRTPNAVLGGITPTQLVTVDRARVLIEDVDLSAAMTHLFGTSGAGSSVLLLNCPLPAAQYVSGAPLSPGAVIDLVQSDSAGVAYRQERYGFEATLTGNVAVTRAGGASDGTTPLSWQIVTNATARWADSFETFPIGAWNPTTGANVTVTICGLANAAALPNNDDIWIETNYLGASGTPAGSFLTSTKANILAAAAAVAADTSTWNAPARINTHSYALGEVIAVGSNTGRVFYCTTAGISAGSLPAGYASAVDGDSVTDGAAVFRAGVRFALVAVLTGPQPQMAGYVRAAVRIGKASMTYHVDPLITLS